MAFLDETTALGEIFGEFGYLAPFVVLLLCGVGLPLPEEVSLIGAGILVYRGEVEFLPIVAVCSAAILIGDSIPYWLGRRYGMSALQIPWVAKIIHPERFSRFQARFEEHGNWAIFACRFVAGIRLPGYFLAGAMRMTYPRFLLLDSLGVLISVPVSIYLGRLFGGEVDKLKDKVHDIHLILAFLVIAMALILLVRSRRRPKTAAADKAPPAPPPVSGEDPARGSDTDG